METIIIISIIFITLITIAFIRKYVRYQENQQEIMKLRQSLIHGGHGSQTKFTGSVEMEVGGQMNGSAAVCISRDLNVMHWWRATGQNGTNLLGNCVSSEEVTARSVVAALRLWGQGFEEASKVTIHSSLVTESKMKNFVLDQLGDCQDKFGVRVVWEQHSDYFNQLEQDQLRGGQELVQQLVRGDGAGQQDQGLHNINLRVMNGSVFQLVNHNSKLNKHYFSS